MRKRALGAPTLVYAHVKAEKLQMKRFSIVFEVEKRLQTCHVFRVDRSLSLGCEQMRELEDERENCHNHRVEGAERDDHRISAIQIASHFGSPPLPHVLCVRIVDPAARRLNDNDFCFCAHQRAACNRDNAAAATLAAAAVAAAAVAAFDVMRRIQRLRTRHNLALQKIFKFATNYMIINAIIKKNILVVC